MRFSSRAAACDAFYGLFSSSKRGLLSIERSLSISLVVGRGSERERKRPSASSSFSFSIREEKRKRPLLLFLALLRATAAAAARRGEAEDGECSFRRERGGGVLVSCLVFFSSFALVPLCLLPFRPAKGWCVTRSFAFFPSPRLPFQSLLTVKTEFVVIQLRIELHLHVARGGKDGIEALEESAPAPARKINRERRLFFRRRRSGVAVRRKDEETNNLQKSREKPHTQTTSLIESNALSTLSQLSAAKEGLEEEEQRP